MISVSEHSPGCVEDGEVLIRILVAPQHRAKGKAPRPRSSALTDAERNGLSVLREGLASDLEILSVARELVGRARASQGAKAGVFGVLRFGCNMVRSFCCHPENYPCYCVYDTALKERQSHAEAFQCVSGVDDAIRDARRGQLFDRVKAGFVSVDEFRGGLLKELAPGHGT